MKLSNKTAVVTGASRGIGREIALHLASEGAKVVVNYSGSQAKAEEVVAQIIANGGQAIAHQANVANADDVKGLMAATMTNFGSIDILVNNAGITKDNLIMRMKEEDFDAVVDTNLKSVFLCTKAVSRQMMKQRAGAIINIASIVGVAGNAGQANYVASKAAVIGFTKTAAKEFSTRNIRVNAIAPGFIETEMTAALPEDVKTAMLGQIPLAKLGQASEVAKVVTFLASDDASYMTGQTLHVDGGMVM
ncbi:3-oxoacyl-[acyl-carrier-protein] reductase [Kurthia sibirica]|uniref:3-oxoacyl-[acyl-carrier-protein] reductase n=1 Tax=Kurthia sibirica TaxID=202750 RepID=A0A2U3AQU0_9BACL|nr:3-oxoacyl-[acyl-carrier-protein] reductase [Kurthia sibirica]PWI26866.1 3-oxoacyl-[acyl-carrier-protein] reductase [Kurthia sibirica]GEK32596.1 3-oxoacyl-[acyl-carrier-protein] reductase FabG [Kurthia sibirica]